MIIRRDKMRSEKNSKDYCRIGIILFLLLIVSLYWMKGKDTYFVDEIYSYGLSNSNYLPFLPCDNVWKTSDYYLDYVGVLDDGFDYKSVIYNQSVDCHPPLYYFLLHTVCSLYGGHVTKWMGLYINLFFLMLSIILLYKLLRNVSSDRLAITFVCVYGFSNAYYSNLLYIRMYAPVTLAMVAVLYIHVKMDEKQWNVRTKDLIVLGCISFFGFLTHYFFITYAVFLYVVAIIYMLFYRKYKNLGLYIVTLAITYLLYILFWPYVFQHLFGDKGSSIVQILFSVQEIYALKSVIEIIKYYICGNRRWIIFVIAIMCIIGVISRFCEKKKDKPNKFRTILFIPVLADIIIIAGKVESADRYIYPLFPIIVVLILLCINQCVSVIKSKNIKMYVWALVVGGILFFNNYQVAPEYYQYDDTYINDMKSLEGLNCIYINKGWAKYTANVFEFTQYGNIFVTDKENMEWMKNDIIIKNSEKLVVYIDNELNKEEIIADILKYTNFLEYRLISDEHNYSAVYIID